MDTPRQSAALRDLEEISESGFAYGRIAGEQPPSRTPLPEGGWTGYSWLLWEKRRLLAKVAFRVMVLTSLVTALIPSRYASIARIMPPEQGGNAALLSLLAGRAGGGEGGGSSGGGLASLAGNVLGASTKGALFVGLAKSRTVEEHIVDRYDLKKVYGVHYEQDACKALEKNTEVEEDRKSGVLSITVIDKSPRRARDVAQAYVDELDRLLSQVSTSSARRERIFIEQRLTSVKADLEDAEQQFSVYASKKGTLDIKEQAKASLQAAAVLQGQLIAAESELQGLEQIYTENNVRVRSLKARIGELQSQVQKLGGLPVTGGTSTSGDSGNADETKMYPSIRELPLVGVEWADLYRRVKLQETVYELLNQQYELTRIQEAKEIGTIRVVDPANVPEKKSWPPRLLIVLLVTCFSILVTASYLLASAYWDKVDPRTPGKLLAQRVWSGASKDARTLMRRLRPARFRSQPFDDSPENLRSS